MSSLSEGTAPNVVPPASAEANLRKQREYAEQRRMFWDGVARKLPANLRPARHYRRCLISYYRFLVPPGMRVLEIGCGAGDLLAGLEPGYGVGVDLSVEMAAHARAKHPHLHFQQGDVHELDLGETFDYILCSDLINDLWDVQAAFERIRKHCHPATRLILNTYSRVWELPRRLAEKAGIAVEVLPQNWITLADTVGLLRLADFEVIRTNGAVLCPVPVPLLAGLANRFLARLWPFRSLTLTHIVVARCAPAPPRTPEPIVSVVVAARNEEGNIPHIFDRVPQMGSGTELVFVEGNSKDDTYGAIEREIARRPGVRAKLFKQPGKGKGDAVRVGFREASGEVLMILDADLTVPPEDLPRFYEAWRSGKAEFVNGVRLMYPMEERAMRFFNLLGNRFFSLMFSWLLDQSIKDTLCGTKVLGKRQYDMIAANRAYFGDFDPFGDFDLIFGAAKYSLKILDLPVRYRERTYGETNIQRWSHGWLLLKMVLYAMRRIKFV